MQDAPAPYQALLFPADNEEAILHTRCSRFKRLTRPGQAIVAAHYRLLGKKTTRPTQEEIIRESGLPRSTAYEVIKRDAMGIYSALKEAQQICLADGAEFGTAALIVCGIKLYHALLGGRATNTITSQELAIMVHCAEITGFIVGKSSSTAIQVTAPDGTRIQVAQQNESPLNSVFDNLRARWGGTEDDADEHDTAENVQEGDGTDQHGHGPTPGGQPEHAAAPARRLEPGQAPGPLDQALEQLRTAVEQGAMPR